MYELNREELRAVQLKSLEILLYFKSICEKENLLFYFCGGCCIGALRHKGFIPWDDDIDVFMPRKDYEKLIKVWYKYANNDSYQIHRSGYTEGYEGGLFTSIYDNQTTFIKEERKNLDINHGIALEILPLDGCPSSGFKRKKQIFWALIFSLYSAKQVPKNHGIIISIISKICLILIPFKKSKEVIWKYAEKQMSKYKIDDCDYITELCAGPHYMKNRYPKKAFDKAVYIDFEGYKMPIPIGYDDYLKIAFGNYMTMPPIEKQEPHHFVEFCDVNSSYKKYKGIYYCKKERS
ncbi:LicD family protein [[Clostridium] innocuum]|nr:LicD family protein [[Clostridium] innocuum]